MCHAKPTRSQVLSPGAAGMDKESWAMLIYLEICLLSSRNCGAETNGQLRVMGIREPEEK